MMCEIDISVHIIRSMHVDETRIKIHDTHHCNILRSVFALKLVE